MIEIWKDIPGYENEYQISNLGRVKALSRKVSCRGWKIRTIKERILKPGKGSNGYMIVALFRKQKQDCRTVHRLLAEAFIPNPQNKRTINHINGIRYDNRIENLEWATDSENIKHGIQILGHKRRRTAKITENQVREIRSLSASNPMVSQGEIGKMYGLKQSTVWSIINNKTWKDVI